MKAQVRTTPPSGPPERFTLDVCIGPEEGSTLAADVAEGLAKRPTRLHPKHFYDDEGSELFDRICDTPEYYPTRAELALLRERAGAWMERLRPTAIVELGSGAARKTRALLDAAQRQALTLRYIPFDVSEGILRSSAAELLATYDWLRIDGIVGDYDRHLARIPADRRRLFAFLGGTIGNFEEAHATEFLGKVAAQMGPDDHLLLGTDLVKDRALLHAAYNDAAGLTAAFNKNVLAVINRELGGDFDLSSFEHLAFFSEERSRIEMHLRAMRPMRVKIAALEMQIDLAAGETIHTENSRKFSRSTVEELLREAGLELMDWSTPEDSAFALSLSRRMR